MADFPPDDPVVVTQTIPSYLYVQYADDDDLQAFVAGYNGMAQYFVDWFVGIGIPIYTGLTGPLLDWVAQGLYGITRPTSEIAGVPTDGPYNTVVYNAPAYPYNTFTQGTASTFSPLSDDLFKRVLTWHIFRDDGKTFSILWLKRRVLRFLIGVGGSAPNVADTSEISVTITGSTVAINLSAVTGVPSSTIDVFLYLIDSGLLELPPPYVYQIIP